MGTRWGRSRDAMGTQQGCDGDAVGMQQGCHGDAAGMPWRCHRDAAGIQWGCSRDAMGMQQGCYRDATGRSSVTAMSEGRGGGFYSTDVVAKSRQAFRNGLNAPKFACPPPARQRRRSPPSSTLVPTCPLVPQGRVSAARGVSLQGARARLQPGDGGPRLQLVCQPAEGGGFPPEAGHGRLQLGPAPAQHEPAAVPRLPPPQPAQRLASQQNAR